MDRSMHTTAALAAGVFALYVISLHQEVHYSDILIPIMLFAGMNVPDLDTSRFLHHRRTLHGCFALLVLTFLITLAGFNHWELAFYLYLIPVGMGMHIIQDMATASGCTLFYPLSKRKYRYAKLKGHGAGALLVSITLGLVVGWGTAVLYVMGSCPLLALATLCP